MYTEGRAEMDNFYADYSQFFDYGVQGPSYSAGVAKTNGGDLTGSYKTRNGTEPEVIDAQYGRGQWTRGQKLALTRGTRHAASLVQNRVWRPQTCSE